MKRLSAILFVSLLVFLLSACLAPSLPADSGIPVQDDSTLYPNEASAAALPLPFSREGTIEETVLIDNQDVKITAKELIYTDYSADLKLLVENRTDKALTFSSGKYSKKRNSVNGYMNNDAFFSCKLRAGESAPVVMQFHYGELLPCGFDCIADIHLGFISTDETFAETDYGFATIRTSLADSYDYTENRYQKLIQQPNHQQFDHYRLNYFSDTNAAWYVSGVHILSEAFVTNQKNGDAVLLLEVENTSSETRIFQISDAMVNGLAIQSGSWSSTLITPHTRALIELPVSSAFDQSYLAAYGITDIFSINFSVTLTDAQTKLLFPAQPYFCQICTPQSAVFKKGQLLYEDGYLSVYYQGLMPDAYLTDGTLHLLLLAENHTQEQKQIGLLHHSFLLNGTQVDCNASVMPLAPAGSAALDLVLTSDVLEDAAVTDSSEIESISLQLDLRNNTYDSLLQPQLELHF